MRMKKLVAAAAALMLVLAGCGGGGAQEAATDADLQLVTEGTLTCVSELGFAPFEYIEEGSTEPVGYDIDVANEIASRLGLECTFLPNQDFDTLLPTIQEGGKADIAIAGITITDKRLEQTDFSDPYYTSNLAIVVKADSGLTTDDLNAADKVVVSQTGTSGDDWVKENLPDCDAQPLKDVTACEMGVSTGKFDAFVIDLPVAKRDLKKFTDLTILEEIPTGEEYGIAVSKDNPALLSAVNQALADMQEDGTLQKIWDKWMVDTEVSE